MKDKKPPVAPTLPESDSIMIPLRDIARIAGARNVEFVAALAIAYGIRFDAGHVYSMLREDAERLLPKVWEIQTRLNALRAPRMEGRRARRPPGSRPNADATERQR